MMPFRKCVQNWLSIDSIKFQMLKWEKSKRVPDWWNYTAMGYNTQIILKKLNDICSNVMRFDFNYTPFKDFVPYTNSKTTIVGKGIFGFYICI